MQVVYSACIIEMYREAEIAAAATAQDRLSNCE